MQYSNAVCVAIYRMFHKDRMVKKKEKYTSLKNDTYWETFSKWKRIMLNFWSICLKHPVYVRVCNAMWKVSANSSLSETRLCFIYIYMHWNIGKTVIFLFCNPRSKFSSLACRTISIYFFFLQRLIAFNYHPHCVFSTVLHLFS